MIKTNKPNGKIVNDGVGKDQMDKDNLVVTSTDKVLTITFGFLDRVSINQMRWKNDVIEIGGNNFKIIVTKKKLPKLEVIKG